MIHPVGIAVVGRLRIDTVSRCPWIELPGGAVAEIRFVDDTIVDASAPGGSAPNALTLTRDDHVLAQSGDRIQATVDPAAAIKRPKGCPLPRGTELLAVGDVRLHP